jgi:hypothetical protein
MHFVREFAGKTVVRTAKKIYAPSSGELIQTLPQVWLNWHRGVAPDWAVEAGEPLFSWSTRPRPGSIGGADVPVQSWMCYVDTEEWQQTHGHPDDVRIALENYLLTDPDSKQVFPPVLAPPWPKYDELQITKTRTAEKVAESHLLTAESIGVTVEELIKYEAAKQAREEVLVAYEEALEAAPVEPELTALGVEA